MGHEGSNKDVSRGPGSVAISLSLLYFSPKKDKKYVIIDSTVYPLVYVG